MKTAIATVIALTVSAPAFAQVDDVQAFFAMGNDSAAEIVLGDTSAGDNQAALEKFAATKDSAAERNSIIIGGNEVSRNVQAFFALGNDSAAEVTQY